MRSICRYKRVRRRSQTNSLVSSTRSSTSVPSNLDEIGAFTSKNKPVFKTAEMQRRSFNALNSVFVVDAEYEFVKELGQGAYGCVVSARHRRTGEGCAIKKITNINTKVVSSL